LGRWTTGSGDSGRWKEVKLRVLEIDKFGWERFAQDARRTVFNETMPPEYDRIDYALLVIGSEKDEPVAYMTVRELDADSAYLKHGGAFPPVKGTFHSLKIYMEMLDYLKPKYKRLTTLVENTNTVYLKMALTAGFKIIGIRNFEGSILVELYLKTGE
jgi:hypothetical protein